ncbi:hypothetical protein [Dyadobacter luticola]|uniref:Uncharacterized protein n=1 Tax=Dyadobacter luticola TaxID=1979387 RepID=A0A5R9KXS8_9BACT|nr:hypothetical protein [Dyadobacter luticola]TLV01073.1 hypothetical protein FEN17_16580 [Dyadobacter luticola]
MIKYLLLTCICSAFLISCNTKSDSTSEKQETEKPVQGYECFIYKAKKDSAFLHINLSDSIVTGELSYAFFEKDKNQGKIKGKMRGDTLLANYTFSSEGMESRREVVFLKNGSGWTEGFGDVTETDSITTFKDLSKIKFDNGLDFKGLACPESIQ